jgi:hypothetical protein
VSNPSVATYQLGAAVANGICLSQKPSGAGALTLNGSLVSGGVATMDVARRVLVASSGSDAAVVFTITGTDRYGNTQKTTVTGVTSTAPQFTVLDFKTVTGVSSSAGTAGNITVGTNGVGSMDWLTDNWLAPDWSLSIRISGPAGTNYTFETTLDDPCFMPGQPNFSLNPGSTSPPTVWADPVVQNSSGQVQFQYGQGNMIFAHRLTIVSGTGAVTMWSIQAGIGDT